LAAQGCTLAGVVKRRRAATARGVRIGEAAAIVAIGAALSVVALTLIAGPGGHKAAAGASVRKVAQRSPATTAQPAPGHMTTTTSFTATAGRRHRAHRSAAYRIRMLTVRLTHPSRRIGTAPRSFLTIIRYPVAGPGQNPEPFPLIVFGHGFAVSPAPYVRLLDAWARAGYVVAAPVFPLENANHPGGPDENDLPNQPGDMSLTITDLSERSQSGNGPLAGLIDPRRVAVTGQSDGGDTALAAAYDPAVRDSRVGAAMILSGAEDPFAAPFAMPPDGPPLLAVQGTADTINPPGDTYMFYRQAARPKILLNLLGAGHLPPYTEPGPQLSAVERTTIAFLNWRFKHRPAALRALLAAGRAGPGTSLTSAG
jgi:fermentation-respiration switch protein FrsA (DUF1100 family)